MRVRDCLSAFLLVALLAASAAGAEPSAKPAKVYGEWRILIKPDKGGEYNALIEKKGLPLFREAGGRMVGWWTTLIGNLYEHVTIWEYDDMAAFERAVEFLGKEKRFAEFVSERDPLLAGEESRFLRLLPWAESPALPESSKFVIHEIHRVPAKERANYLRYMREEGFKHLKNHGFRPVGPWIVEVGDWSEVTYLFRFDSLAERERLIAEFAAHNDGRIFGDAVGNLVEKVVTRLLMPAPFAGAPAGKSTAGLSSNLFPHLAELAPGVFAAGFSDRFGSANCGWTTLGDGTLLIDLPRGAPLEELLAEVEKISGRPVRKLALTRFQPGDEEAIASLVSRGVNEIVTSGSVRERLNAAWKGASPPPVRGVSKAESFRDDAAAFEILPADHVFARGAAAVYLPRQRVLFAGPLVVNGPRTPLAGSDSEWWIQSLQRLARLQPAHVVPGFGSWGSAEVVSRQERFLLELRRQVGYAVSMGRSEASLKDEVRIPAGCLVWMPYDTPNEEDLAHVYKELTVPYAPFHGKNPGPHDSQPNALVLIADQPHEPGHIVEGLTPVFEATGVTPHFTVDVRALSAENLAKVNLLVILRDGLQRPTNDPATHYVWMTPEQQEAIDQWVKAGGAFLNLHNSMGLYPDEGPYLKLVGGKYIGHGPLERFRVEVVDPDHPVTRGVEGFSVADEQHTPPYDPDKVHLLLRNRSDDGKVAAAAGWAYEPGQGRLCHLANGHTRESLLHPAYQRLMRNAVEWCLRRDAQ